MAVFRVVLYSLAVGVADFLTDTESWSQETWNNTGLFLKVRMFASNGVAMVMVVIAFLDTTMTQLRNGNGSTNNTDIKP